ncbi:MULTISPECIES: hypothetical protein [Flavobacterium]|uniref:Uncharacterized protein n=1 Tax=Flavobacterium aurantiibacter TaxID=2023067 RepID=A0A255ZPY9_9FLAO|nr:hypothetical protein [Flavobacterium aurantiibacter]OYQ43526.1 hypothetical protein CHX27_09805 [Flavobacterium aurantiibacter]
MKTINILSAVLFASTVFTANASTTSNAYLNGVSDSIRIENSGEADLDLSGLKRAEKTIDEQIAEDMQVTEAQLPKYISVAEPAKTVKIPTKLLN